MSSLGEAWYWEYQTLYRVQLHYISALCISRAVVLHLWGFICTVPKTFILILVLLRMLIMNMLSGNTKLAANLIPRWVQVMITEANLPSALVKRCQRRGNEGLEIFPPPPLFFLPHPVFVFVFVFSLWYSGGKGSLIRRRNVRRHLEGYFQPDVNYLPCIKPLNVTCGTILNVINQTPLGWVLASSLSLRAPLHKNNPTDPENCWWSTASSNFRVSETVIFVKLKSSGQGYFYPSFYSITTRSNSLRYHKLKCRQHKLMSKYL